jgi:hypothetical protein
MAQYLLEGLVAQAALVLIVHRCRLLCSIASDLWVPRWPSPPRIRIAFDRSACTPGCCAMIDAAFPPRMHPYCRSTCVKSAKSFNVTTGLASLSR